ncbi:Helix-turn-helix [bacterium A37T11]|nr:Helix-turn-helix [bacterium A37T11]
MANKNLEKFKQLVSADDQAWLEKVNWRKKNRAWLKKSAAIALKVLRTLRERGLSQKELAEQLDISAQQISKILKGGENLTLETISKLEAVLGIELINVPVYVSTETKEQEISVPAHWFAQPTEHIRKEKVYSYDYDSMLQESTVYPNGDDITAA